MLQTEVTSEDKRHQHQKELAHKMNDDAKERMQGMKSNVEEKKSVVL